MAFRGPTREEISQTISVSRDALQGLYRSRLPQMAAALSYRTIFGLLPAIVVALVALKAFATAEDIKGILERALEYSGIKQIVVDEEQRQAALGPIDEVGQDVDEAIDQPLGIPEQPNADDEQTNEGDLESGDSSSGAVRLDEWITKRVEAIGKLNIKTIGIIGGAVLIYAAISMLVEIERAFNQIYHARGGRSWTKRITQYWVTLTLGAIVLVATFYLGERFRGWIADLTATNGLTGGQVTLTIVGFMTTVLISMLLLVFLYTTMPTVKVKARCALAGAFVGAILWETGKWGFTRYIGYSSNLERLYGQMALLPLFLLWVYVTWIIVLFGLKVSFGLQHFSALRQAMHEDDDRSELVDPLAVLNIVIAVGKAFSKGKTLNVSEIGDETGLPQDAAQRLLDALADAHVVNRVSDTGYALARPADQIDAADLVAIGQRMVSEPVHDRTRGFYEDLQARTRQLVAGRTVASLVDQETPHEDDSSQSGTDGDPSRGGR